MNVLQVLILINYCLCLVCVLDMIFVGKKKPEKIIAWMLLMIVPFVGLFIYILIGAGLSHFVKRIIKKLELSSEQYSKHIKDQIKMLKDSEEQKTYPEQYKDLMANPDKYEIRDNELVDISGTQSSQNKVNIAKYEDLIRAAKEKYDLFLSSPVKYSGSYYLPRYLDDYEKLQFRAFPQEIWDAKGTSSKVMTKNDFIGLKTFLEDLVNKAYKEKKETIKKYKLAIKKLEGK